MRPTLVSIVVPLIALAAGCVEPTAPTTATVVPPDALASMESEAISVLTWNGHISTNAMYEPPAHLAPTEPLVEAFWDSGFNLMTSEAPSIVEIRFDWTSSRPQEMMMMAHAPDDPSDPRSWVEYEYPTNHATTLQYPSSGPLCMRIDAVKDKLPAGHWHIMAHSKPGAGGGVGSQISLNFTLTLVGGAGTIPTEGVHGHPLDMKEVEESSELYTEQAEGKQRAWKACRLSGDDVKP